MKRFYSAAPVFFVLLVCQNLAAATGASHGINWWGLGAQYKDAPALGWLTITFFIFVYGLARVLRKPLSLYLEARSRDIKNQIEEGRKAKEESEKKVAMYQEKLSSLDAEIEQLKAAFQKQAEAEKKERQRLIEEVEARVMREAEDTIKADFERSKNRLAEEVISKALVMARATIETQERDAVDEFLKRSFIDDLKAQVKTGTNGAEKFNVPPVTGGTESQKVVRS